MSLLIWINAVFGMLATGYGMIVVRGVVRGTLRSKWPARFLVYSLLASLAGLPPLTRHITPLQHICMLSVYCSAAAVAAWLKFHLFGFWRPVFALSVTSVLYLDLVSGSLQLLTIAHLFISRLEEHFWAFRVLQFGLAAVFGVLGALALRNPRPEPTRSL
jgi:hypothetical protein